jgi:RND family efflux transporter MFP subunit
MKKFLALIVVCAACGALTWVVWFKPPAHEEEEEKIDTEVPVHVGAIVRATLHGYTTAYGTVEAAPAAELPAASARVAPAASGIVASVACKEGQRVEKGALLFTLDGRAADVAVEKATRAVAFAEQTLERQKELAAAEATSQKLLQEAEQAVASARADLAAAKTQRALLNVEAPLAGTVVRVNAKPGESADATSVLAEIIDLERLVVSAAVPSAELSAVKLGAPAEVVVDGKTAGETAIAYVSASADAKTGTVLVRASLAAGSGLRPGACVTLRIVSEEHANALAAPAEAVVRSEDGETVISRVEGDKAARVPVKAGLHDRGLVEIEGDGLKEGMAIVTEGAYGLPKETKIRVLGKQ